MKPSYFIKNSNNEKNPLLKFPKYWSGSESHNHLQKKTSIFFREKSETYDVSPVVSAVFKDVTTLSQSSQSYLLSFSSSLCLSKDSNDNSPIE